jgi:cytochrome c6
VQEASGLLKNSMLCLTLSSAAPQRCDNRAALRAISALELTFSNRKLLLPRFTSASLSLIALALFSTYTFAAGAADIYKTKCSACHAANGAGDTMLGENLKLRSLASPEVQNQSDDALASIISKGKNRMPGYGRKLSPQQISEVVKYMRTLKK